MATLKDKYKSEIAPLLKEELGLENVMEIPRITKITLNMGVSEAVADKKVMDHAVSDLTKIAGLKPVVTKAKKAIAGFKIRQGMPIGVAVTLRGDRMYAFLERLIHLALPRIRDFRGVGNRLDGRGNYSLGISDHTIFPETQADGQQRANIGMDVCIATSAQTDDEGRELLRLLGMPFRRASAATAETAKA